MTAAGWTVVFLLSFLCGIPAAAVPPAALPPQSSLVILAGQLSDVTLLLVLCLHLHPLFQSANLLSGAVVPAAALSGPQLVLSQGERLVPPPPHDQSLAGPVQLAPHLLAVPVLHPARPRPVQGTVHSPQYLSHRVLQPPGPDHVRLHPADLPVPLRPALQPGLQVPLVEHLPYLAPGPADDEVLQLAAQPPHRLLLRARQAPHGGRDCSFISGPSLLLLVIWPGQDSPLTESAGEAGRVAGRDGAALRLGEQGRGGGGQTSGPADPGKPAQRGGGGGGVIAPAPTAGQQCRHTGTGTHNSSQLECWLMS